MHRLRLLHSRQLRLPRSRRPIFDRCLSHSRRLLLRIRQAWLSRLSQPAVYRSYRGGTGARPPPPPVAAFGEIETAHLAGIRSLRTWRWVRKHGGFPEPARRTPQGPIWTAAQIAQWLAAQLAAPIAAMDQLDQGEGVPAEVSEDEAALLAEIEQLEPA